VQILRSPAKFRISIKDLETGEHHKIELIRHPASSRKFLIRFNGKYSKKIFEGGIYEVCRRLGKLLQKMR
jgi:hypothetical protein